jgi:RNA polymerase sigma-70 factor, ECF subfamily
MNESSEFTDQLIAAIPGLRAFGVSLTSKTDRADDLVQETMLKAWKHHEGLALHNFAK